MNKMVLLVVDVQNAIVMEHPYEEEKVLGNIQALIAQARKNQIEVIYVRHDDGVGTEFEVGSDTWQIHETVEPQSGEKIVDKQFNSAFHKTDLQMYLSEAGVDTIMLVGMQTEYCIDATLRSAFDLNYKVLIPEQTNTSFDNPYMQAQQLIAYYNSFIWNGRYAKIVPMEEALNYLQ
jgi:nicotinamidase-related amidase